VNMVKRGVGVVRDGDLQVENKKSREPRGKQCHTKTVMIRKSYETQRQTPTMSRLGSVWRKKDEGMIEKKCWTSRPDEVKKCVYLEAD